MNVACLFIGGIFYYQNIDKCLLFVIIGQNTHMSTGDRHANGEILQIKTKKETTDI